MLVALLTKPRTWPLTSYTAGGTKPPKRLLKAVRTRQKEALLPPATATTLATRGPRNWPAKGTAAKPLEEMKRAVRKAFSMAAPRRILRPLSRGKKSVAQAV